MRPSLRFKAMVSAGAVRKIRSPVTIGEEMPSGIATFQRRLLDGPKPMGGVAVSETARPPGPRNCGQSSPRAVSIHREIAIERRRRSRMAMNYYRSLLGGDNNPLAAWSFVVALSATPIPDADRKSVV